MSCSFYAHTVLGIKVDPERLYTEVKVHAFDHGHPEDWDVDPKSGKKLWRTERMGVDGVDYGEDDVSIGGYEVVGGQDGETAYIALFHSSVSSDGGRSKPAFIEILAHGVDLRDPVYEMVDKLEPLGFWDSKTFGLHTFMVVSG